MAVAVAAVIALASCSEEQKRKALLPNISGKAGEVIVVIDKGNWEGAVGNVLRDSLAAEAPFLPQREPLFGLVNVPKNAFTNMFQIHRNIIVLNIDSSVTEPGIVIRKDVWAAPQTVIYVNAADSEAAVKVIEENSALMVVTIEQAERDRIIRNIKKYEELKVSAAVTGMIGGSPHFPSGYKLKKKTSDFIWVEYAIQDMMQGVLIYKYPVVEGENMMAPENLLKAQSEMLKNNVPGMFENTYMIISPIVSPAVSYKKYGEHEFAEIRGLWEVHNDYMGGPFVSHVFYTPDGKNMIMMQAFVYAPKYDKRGYLKQVESVLYSFELAEQSQSN